MFDIDLRVYTRDAGWEGGSNTLFDPSSSWGYSVHLPIRFGLLEGGPPKTGVRCY